MTGDLSGAAKDAATQGLFMYAFSKLSGPSSSGAENGEDQIASRIATAAADGRRSLAMEFYQQAGYSADEAAMRVAAIDLTRPVEKMVLSQGSQVAQFQVPGKTQGNYYAPIGSDVESLGVKPEGRVLNIYTTTREVTVLRSTTADTTHNTNLPPSVRGPGGGEQYFSVEKDAFQRK